MRLDDKKVISSPSWESTEIFRIFHDVYPDFWAPKMKNGAREARNCYSNRFKYKITGVIGNFRRPSVKQTGNPIHVKDSTRGCF